MSVTKCVTDAAKGVVTCTTKESPMFGHGGMPWWMVILEAALILVLFLNVCIVASAKSKEKV